MSFFVVYSLSYADIKQHSPNTPPTTAATMTLQPRPRVIMVVAVYHADIKSHLPTHGQQPQQP